MGIDDNYDGHVDRWDRDESLRANEESSSSSSSGAAAAAASDAGAPKADGGK
jgi:hypothetical protein